LFQSSHFGPAVAIALVVRELEQRLEQLLRLAEENARIETALQRIIAELKTAKAENDRLRADEPNPIREDRI
jgi:hypothetical protein